LASEPDAFQAAVHLSTMPDSAKRAELDVWLMRYFVSRCTGIAWCVPRFEDVSEFRFVGCWAFSDGYTGHVPLLDSIKQGGKTTMLRRVIAAFLCAKTASVYPGREVIVPRRVQSVCAVRWHEPLPKMFKRDTLYLVDDDDVRSERWRPGSADMALVVNGEP
jgi:hypothetical protein